MGVIKPRFWEGGLIRAPWELLGDQNRYKTVYSVAMKKIWT
ncbi:hypothetical protein [Virgibacillus salidurans]|nr:hypothetical protein [Virgibacillus sp. NKC19-16]